MSLIAPTKMEKVINIWKKWPVWARVGVPLALGLIVLLFVLWSWSAIGDWRFNSKQDKLKANVNAALANIEQRNAVIANLKEQQAVETEDVRRNAQEYLEAQNATNAAKAETDKAIEKMKQAANANGNVSVANFKEALRGL